MTWYTFTVPALQGSLLNFKVLEKCEPLIGRKGNEDIAVFELRGSSKDRTYYLPDAAYSFLQPLIEEFGPTTCDQPDKDSVSMVCGNVFAKDRLFNS